MTFFSFISCKYVNAVSFLCVLWFGLILLIDLMEVHSNHNDHISGVSGNSDVFVAFPALDYPLNVMLPVEIVTFLDETRGVIRPSAFRGQPGTDSESGELEKWQRQTMAFSNMHDDLQLNAPHLPQFEMVDNGILQLQLQ